MSIEFLKATQINAVLENLIEDAQQYLYLICPYIKLHSKLKDELKSKIHDSNLKIIVVFGKNQDNKDRSLSKDDFDFLMQFPNIEIRYEAKLHAKYYANDKYAIVTSMNLYDYSHNNNIEVGILMTVKNSILTSLANQVVIVDNPERDAYEYMDKVIKNAEELYIKKPNFKKSILGLQGDYIDSTVLVDKLSSIYSAPSNEKLGYKSWDSNPKNVAIRTPVLGYCIRTGVQIPFSLEKPYSDNAYNSYLKWGNDDYQEKYCHFSGEQSNGHTCFAKPILVKNWKIAKRTHNL